MAKKKDTIDTIDEYKAFVAEAVAEELSIFDPLRIRSKIRGMLEENAFSFVMSALGLKKNWNNWEVDHCNGLRNKVADIMLSEASGAAEKWIKEQAGKLPELPAGAVKALHRDYLDYLKREIQDAIWDQARKDAKVQVAKILSGEAAG